MNKYIKPEMEIKELFSADVIAASTEAVEYKSLEGVDKDGEKSAVIDVRYWF